ncbi:MAG: AAA family ATPase, partial [Flavobacteriaceae bacterium]|nr:AAA family ATPase [Flavobacteriaceae bacterium]
GYYEKIHGAELRIPLLDAEGNVEKLICVKGNFAEDPLNFLFLHGEVKEKKDAFQHLLLQNSRFSRQFTVDYIKQLPIKTFFTTSREEFLDQVDQDFTDFQQLNQKTLQVLIEKFSTSEFEEQMRTLSLLLLEGNGTKGYFMFSQTCDSFPGFREITQRCLHHSLWTKLEGMETRISALKDNIDELRNNSVPLDEQILAAEMPEDAKCKALDRLKLAQGHPLMGGGDSKAKEWIELLLKMPWGKVVPTGIDMKNSTSSERSEYLKNFRGKLDEAVYGQNEAKDIFEDIVAEWIGSGKETGDVIVIQGPAGNGKTTLVKEGICKAMNRPFAFIALGGMQDSSYLQGHEITYEGSKCGRIIEMLTETGCMNPIIFFDELDKVSDTPKGEEITNLLCHLTDASQNKEFHDKYFSGINFDLSRATLIFSYNNASAINPILLDRMYKIKTKGFDKKAKTKIATDYLLPKILTEFNFHKNDIQFDVKAIHNLIDNFSDNEEGVRNLKRNIETIIFKLNVMRYLKPENVKLTESNTSSDKSQNKPSETKAVSDGDIPQDEAAETKAVSDGDIPQDEPVETKAVSNGDTPQDEPVETKAVTENINLSITDVKLDITNKIINEVITEIATEELTKEVTEEVTEELTEIIIPKDIVNFNIKNFKIPYNVTEDDISFFLKNDTLNPSFQHLYT